MRSLTLVILAAVLSAAGPLRADEPAPASESGAPDGAIRFSFSGATYDEVLDYFSRVSGLPIVREVDVPSGTLTYLSPGQFSLEEGLGVLNVILQARGVSLRVDDDMLYLQSLDEMQRENIPTFIGELPADVSAEQIVTVVRPLDNALATSLAEQLAKMVASYGAITPLQEQNALVITETAAQVRRLSRIIEELDREDVEGQVRVFKVSQTQATDLMEPLQALLSERVQKYVINQKGQQVKIEEESLPGVKLTVDPRTNSIIAKGAESRIEQVAEVIELLDVPATTGQRVIRSVVLGRLSTDEAVGQAEKLFATLEPADRPTIITRPQESKLTIVGDMRQVSELLELLGELDDRGEASTDSVMQVSLVRLEHTDAASVMTALDGLLAPRQREAIRIARGATDRSLVLSGYDGDVEVAESLVELLDEPNQRDRRVRLIRLDDPDAADLVERTRTLHAAEADPTDPSTKVEATLDADGETLTLVGRSTSIDRFVGLLEQVRQVSVVDRVTTEMPLEHEQPSRLAGSLRSLLAALMQGDESRAPAPEIVPIDELDVILLTGTPAQLERLGPIVETLDRPNAADFQMKVMAIKSEQPSALIEEADEIFQTLARHAGEEASVMPATRFDERSGQLVVSGHVEAVRLFDSALAQARQLMPPSRTGRIIAMEKATASEIVAPLAALAQRIETSDAGRTIPPPTIEVIEETNSLYVVAEQAQHAMIERFARQLDSAQYEDLPPMRLLQLRTTDAGQLASVLRERYNARPAEQRRERPVEIDSDPTTNVLIVAAHDDLYEEVKGLVESLNTSASDTADRETMLFPLRRARAEDLARALEKLYPEPPMPVDRRGRPMPHLREPREIQVSSDSATNTLIIEAPAERKSQYQALVEQLDRVDLPPQAELRTYRLERVDPDQIVRTLSDLARRGVLSEPPADGSKPVEVLVQAEPMSRTLIVAGDATTFSKVEAILADLQAVPVKRSLKIFEVQSTDPAAIASTALRLFEEQHGPDSSIATPSIEVDDRNGTLMVVAEDEAMVSITSILNELERSVIPPPDVRLIPLDYAESEEVVEFLRELSESSLAIQSSASRVTPQFESIGRTNAILVAAAPDQHQVIRSIIDGLDVLENDEMPPLRILRLRSADAANVASALQRQYNSRPVEERSRRPVTITADVATNTLLVAAHAEMLAELQAIVQELNEAEQWDYEGREIRIFPLKVAEAEQLASTIDEMFPEPAMPRDSRGRPRPDLMKPREVVVRADSQTNSLIVDAPVARMAGFQTLVDQLDRQQIADDTRILTYQVKYADVETLASTLQSLADDGSLAAPEGGRRAGVTVISDPTSGTLVISGPSRAFDAIEGILTELDVRREGPPTELRFFKLEYARASVVAEMLRTVLVMRSDAETPGTERRIESLLEVTHDSKTNTVILSAPESLMPVAEEIVQQLDDERSVGSASIIRVRPLDHADASAVKSAVEGAMQELLASEEGDEASFRVLTAFEANAIILVGSQRLVSEAERLIGTIDAQPSRDALDARSFALEHVDAGQVAPMIEEILNNQLESDPRFVMERIRRTRGEIVLPMRVRVAAEARSNSIIVSGPRRSVDLVETLLGNLDRADRLEGQTVRIFTPSNGRVDRLADSARSILSESETIGSRSGVRLIDDPAAGIIVLVGQPDGLDRASGLLDELDQRSPRPMEVDVRVFDLEHASARSIGDIVNGFVTDPAKWPSELRRLREAGLSVAMPTLSIDEERERLIVSGPSELLTLIDAVIARVDQPASEGAARELQVFSLVRADARSTADAIQAVLDRGDRGPSSQWEVRAEETSNAVIVHAPSEVMRQIEEIIGRLDGAGSASTSTVRTVFLQHARAEGVASVLRELFVREEPLQVNDLPTWARVDYLRYEREAADGEADFKVSVDAKLNAVVLSASPPMLDLGEQVIGQLDVPRSVDGAFTDVAVHVVPLQHARAVEVAESIRRFFGRDEVASRGITIEVASSSNAILVEADEAGFAEVSKVVERLDEAAMHSAFGLRTIRIDRSKADAREIAEVLRRILRGSGQGVEVLELEDLLEEAPGQMGAPRGGGTESPADPATLPDEDRAIGSQPATEARIIPASLAATDDEPFAQQEETASGDRLAEERSTRTAEQGSAISIGVDERTNSLVFLGGGAFVDRAIELARELEGQLPATALPIRVIRLPTSIDAGGLVRVVSAAVQQSARDVPTGRPAILADRVSNSIVVVADDPTFRTISSLVASMARPSASDRLSVRVYPLSTMTADRAVNSVEQLLGRGRRRSRQADRMVEIQMSSDDREAVAAFDPDEVTVSADTIANSVLVVAPPEAQSFIAEFLSLIDQSTGNDRATLRLFELRYAEASSLESTLRQLFRRRFQSLQRRSGGAMIDPEFVADDRTNTLLVTASPGQLLEVEELLEELDRDLGEGQFELRVVELDVATPSEAATMLERLLLERDQGQGQSTQIEASDALGLLFVRADPAMNAEIDRLLERIDRDTTTEFEVRTIVLERADAAAVAGALQGFFDDRARMASSGRRRGDGSRRITVTGDSTSQTLLVAASDEDFEVVQSLVKEMDSPSATQSLEYRVFPLEHARSSEVTDTLRDLVEDLTWNQGPTFFFMGPRGRANSNQRSRGTLALRSDTRTNSIIATGEGDKFALVEELVELLDRPLSDAEQRVVRVYGLEAIELDVARELVQELFGEGTSQRNWWEPEQGGSVLVQVDEGTRTLLVAAPSRIQDEIAEVLASIDDETATQRHGVEVFSIEYVDAQEIAGGLSRFVRDRARAAGRRTPEATIVASRTANAVIASAPAGEMETIRSLIGELDQEDPSGTRETDIIVLEEGDVGEIARIVADQFRGNGRSGSRITPDPRTQSLIVTGPRDQLADIRALVERLDQPPDADETIVRTYALEAARASEAVDLLRSTLRLDRDGRTSGITVRLEEVDGGAPVRVQATIVADERSNSLLVTATEESFPVIEHLVNQVDDVPAASPFEYRTIPLEHVIADEIAFTLRTFVRGQGGPEGDAKIEYDRIQNQLIVAATQDQFEQIRGIVEQLDVPSDTERRTEFIELEFAEAEQVREALSVFYGTLAMEADSAAKLNTTIVADPVTNSLIISSDEGEWENIRALLSQLDDERFDTSLQLVVFPLRNADSQSVARAINEVFSAAGGDERGEEPERRERSADGSERRGDPSRTVLVKSEEWVRAAAEPRTNSVVVSASRSNVSKVRSIVEQLDTSEYAVLPPPRLISVRSGNPDALAEALRATFIGDDDDLGARVRIIPDVGSRTLIIRADETDFTEIAVLADALQESMKVDGMTVRIVSLEQVAARRVVETIREAFAAKARSLGQSLSIQPDSSGNRLVIAAPPVLIDEVERTVEQLDRLAPAAGQGVFIIDLQHITPEEARQVIESIGLDERTDGRDVRSLVTEPVRVSTMPGRQAVIVVANPADREFLVGLLKSVDAEPAMAEGDVAVVGLRNAEATALADLLSSLVDPESQQANTPLAEALKEQIRRLDVQGDRASKVASLDLSAPIRIIPYRGMNAIIVSSTTDNVRALRRIVDLFDRLPLTDSVTVQLFPLENMAASTFARIVRDLFSQGKSLSQVAGTNLEGMPGGLVGKALLENLALATDDRTNTVVVAGKEDAVAFVEVLSQRLDTGVALGWLEPRILPLRHADAEDLAVTIQSILVEGQRDLPEATPLQTQVGRLRLALSGDDRGGARTIESEIFQPMNRLVVRAEPQLNALILVGTPVNLRVVEELVGMLDTEAASPSAAVRIYPIDHASAARLRETLTSLFQEQVRSKAIRPEDSAVIESDERTNSLIITTSPRTFVVIEGLLELLDAEVAPDLREIRRLQLEHASATRLASLIQELMDARLERLRRTQPETADLERATIVADARTNSLVVAAGNESFEVIRALAAELDDSSLDEQALIEVIPIEHGNVERIAEAVEQVMERRYAEMPREVRASQAPLVLTDPRINSVLVAAGPEDLGAIRRLVEQLDASPMNPAVGLHVVQVPPDASAELLAPRLERLMQDRQQSLGSARTDADRVSIEPDLASGSLIIAASDENLQVIRGLLELLADSEGTGDPSIDVITLRTATAEDVVDLVEELYADEVNRIKGRNTVRVSADEALNAVVVSAPPDDVRAIRGLVDRLDGERPFGVTEIKYIPLKSANALETVQIIERVLDGRGLGQGGRRSAQSTILKYLHDLDDASSGPDEVQVSSAIRDSISLVPDIRTNTVIVSAPHESVGLIEQMIRDLDESEHGDRNIRIYRLENADAEAMAAIITDLFDLEEADTLLIPKSGSGAPAAGPDGLGPDPLDSFAGGLLGGTELTTVPDQRQKLSITVDSRTNSLLVSGSGTYLELVEEVVKELDSQDANEREVFTYPLRNALASEVARVIGEFVDEEQRKLLETLSVDQLGSAARLLEREVTIRGDEKSNTVLVSASPRYMATVKDMIKQLDVDPPQVLIQVMLAEVTLDESLDWGVDLEFQGTINDADVSGGYGLASAFVSGVGVPNISVASGDFNLLIRAIKAQGRLSVLSNPSVMAANNEDARIQVGDVVQLPESQVVSDSGQVSSTLAERELGVILEVTPSINPDGFVRMNITPRISTLSERTTQISEDFEAPVIVKREARTTVTVRDGQTIVIGGLISDRFEIRENKVPVLGDMPLVGELFKNRREVNQKTELLIVLTPYVIDSPSGVDAITGIEVDRLSLPQDVKDSIRRGGLYDAQGEPIPVGGTRERAGESGTGERGSLRQRLRPVESSSGSAG